MTISEWWAGIESFEKFFWYIAIPASLIFLIQTVMSFFGGDMDDMDASGDVEASIEADDGIGFQFFTFKNLIAFFTIFAWVGIACSKGEMATWVVILVATVAGLTMMLIMASLIYYMGKLTEEGNLNLNNAVGKIATVYLTIPAKRDGMGKVQIKLQGFQTLEAMTDSEEAIKTGAVVEVLELINNEILLVKKS